MSLGGLGALRLTRRILPAGRLLNRFNSQGVVEQSLGVSLRREALDPLLVSCIPVPPTPPPPLLAVEAEVDDMDDCERWSR